MNIMKNKENKEEEKEEERKQANAVAFEVL